MVAVGVLLIITGAFGIFFGSLAYGDIGIAGMIAGITALLGGIGMTVARSRIKKLEDNAAFLARMIGPK